MLQLGTERVQARTR